MEKLLKAIYFAANKHLAQKRKGGKIPYIYHPLAVALLLSRVTRDENILVAGILHDSVEDTKTTVNEVENVFGTTVSKLVDECTETNPTETWKKRKSKSLKRIPIISKEAALIKSADTLHNLYELFNKLNEQGISYFDNFNATKKDKLGYEIKRLELLKKFHENDFIDEIEMILGKILNIVNKNVN